MNRSHSDRLSGTMAGSKKSPRDAATSGGRTPEENVHSHSSVVADSNAATASHVIAGSASIEHKRDEIEIRIVYRHGSRISLGSWNSHDGHGGLVVCQNPADLLALADELIAAAKALEPISTPALTDTPAQRNGE